jgi:hypothetical protein
MLKIDIVSFCLPLKIRGIKGVISSTLLLLCLASIALFITPLSPLILRGGDLDNSPVPSYLKRGRFG